MNHKILIQILVLLIGIEFFQIGIEFHKLNQEIDNQKQIEKTQIKTPVAKSIFEIENGWVVGDDIEADGWAGSLDLDVQNQIFEESLVEYSASPKSKFYTLSDEDRYVVKCIVAGEAKGESMEGKMAVAQCLLNAMAKDGLSASEVRKQYQYSGWDDELQNSNPECWTEVCEAVSRVFDDGEFVSENPILYFYAPNVVTSKWHESLPKDQVIGGHSFHYLKEDVNADWFVNLKGEN